MPKITCLAIIVICVLTILGFAAVTIIYTRKKRSNKFVDIKTLMTIFIAMWLSTTLGAFFREQRSDMGVIDIFLFFSVGALFTLFLSLLLYKLIESIVLAGIRSKLFKALKDEKTQNDIIVNKDLLISQIKGSPMFHGALIVDFFFVSGVLSVVFENNLNEFSDYISITILVAVVLFVYVASKQIDGVITNSLKSMQK